MGPDMLRALATLTTSCGRARSEQAPATRGVPPDRHRRAAREHRSPAIEQRRLGHVPEVAQHRRWEWQERHHHQQDEIQPQHDAVELIDVPKR